MPYSKVPHEELVVEALRSFVNTLRNSRNQPRYIATLVGLAAKVETIVLAQPIEKLAIAYKADGEGTALWDAMVHAFVKEKSRKEHIICLMLEGSSSADTTAKRGRPAY